MTKLLKRQLTESEKAFVLQQHGRICFATGHPIGENEEVQFDHIRAFSAGGESDVSNIAPMCAVHNQQKGAYTLFDFREKLRQREFFELTGKHTLNDLLTYLKGKKQIPAYGLPVTFEVGGPQITVTYAHGSITTSIHVCPITRWRYFYYPLGVELICSDEDEGASIGLQPRTLDPEKVFTMFRHFQGHPVLQPAIGRLVDGRIRIFDGQHKIAALLWEGEQAFDCKVYIDPDERLLNDTNIEAHDKLAQTKFYSSVLVFKLGSQLEAYFRDYRENSSDSPKTEEGLMKWLQRQDSTFTPQKTSDLFRSYLYSAVLEDPNNKLAQLISDSNKGVKEKPITIDSLKGTIFRVFLERDPTPDDLLSPTYFRNAELKNMVAVLNMLYEHAFSAWNSSVGLSNDNQRRLDRMLRSKSILIWSIIFKDAVTAKLGIYGGPERDRPLYRNLSQGQLGLIRDVVVRLVDWRGWLAPASSDVDTSLLQNAEPLQRWFYANGLSTGYLMGAAI